MQAVAAMDMDGPVELDDLDRTVLWAMRSVAVGRLDCPSLRRAFVDLYGPGAADQILCALLVMVRLLSSRAAQGLRMHMPGANAVSRDELLTNLTVYWVTNTINSSVRLYCESQRSGRFGPVGARVDVPTGAAVFPKEILKAPRPWAEKAYDLRRYTRFDRGGHFAALEEPDLLVADVRAFFRELR